MLIIAFLAIPLAYDFFNPPFTGIMVYRGIANEQKNSPLNYTPLKKIPHKIQRMAVMVEDQRFYEHMGIDVEAMKDAWDKNEKAGYKKFGASTITQQLARTLFLWPGKSFVRKYLEIIISLEMDLVMPKNRILELYFNYAEWGRGVFGIGAAAKHHYKKDITELDEEEMIKLVVILSNPVKYNIETFQKSPIMASRYLILKNAQEKKLF